MTAVILTKDEAINVTRCLASLVWCEESILVDSGSRDDTVAIARVGGARVLSHIQEGPFNIALQRNWALDHAGIRSEWVLFLDADEEVTAELRDAIESELRTNTFYNAYELTPKYLFWGKWLRRTQGYPNWHARLLRHGQVRFAGGVWEHFESGARIGRIETPYNHFANSKGFSDWLARHDRYSSWDAEKIVAFLATQDPEAIGTIRKARLRRIGARFYPCRPFARFINMFVFRGGFLEGFPAFMFSTLYLLYEWMVVVKVIELRRRSRGLSL